MKVYGNARAGGPLNVATVPYPTDPTLAGRVTPKPPRPTATPKAAKPTRISDTDRRAMCEAYADGERSGLIAARFGCTRQTVHRIVTGAKR